MFDSIQWDSGVHYVFTLMLRTHPFVCKVSHILVKPLKLGNAKENGKFRTRELKLRKYPWIWLKIGFNEVSIQRIIFALNALMNFQSKLKLMNSNVVRFMFLIFNLNFLIQYLHWTKLSSRWEHMRKEIISGKTKLWLEENEKKFSTKPRKNNLKTLQHWISYILFFVISLEGMEAANVRRIAKWDIFSTSWFFFSYFLASRDSMRSWEILIPVSASLHQQFRNFVSASTFLCSLMLIWLFN